MPRTTQKQKKTMNPKNERTAKNLEWIRKNIAKAKSQEKFMKLINAFTKESTTTRAKIGSYEEGRSSVDPTLVKTILECFNIKDFTLDDFYNRNLFEQNVPQPDYTSNAQPLQPPTILNPIIEQQQYISGQKMRILAITTDKTGKENIELVPVKAAAGYATGYSDKTYIETLPKFQMPLPQIKSGRTYRAFEITGDSMFPRVPSGSTIIGEYIDDWNDIKNGITYIVVTEKDGVVYKRIYNNIKETQTLLLQSDNTFYNPYTVNIKDVLEVWKAVTFIASIEDRPNHTTPTND